MNSSTKSLKLVRGRKCEAIFIDSQRGFNCSVSYSPDLGYYNKSSPRVIFDYRRRLEYCLINDPAAEISDVDLISVMKVIRQNTPYCGVSMMYRSLRAQGIKVTREQVRTSLRSTDPIGSALKWPAGPSKRRPYSVAGPNSLWHIYR